MATREERKATYATSSPEIQELYNSELSYALNQEMKDKYAIPEEKSSAFLHATGDVILGFYKIADLPRLLQMNVGMDKESAQKMTADLIDAWGPIVEREATVVEETKDEVAGLAEKIAAIKPQAEGAETIEPTLEPAKPLRTMQTDIDDAQKVHGYGALQEQQQKASEDETVVQATPLDQLRSQPNQQQ